MNLTGSATLVFLLVGIGIARVALAVPNYRVPVFVMGLAIVATGILLAVLFVEQKEREDEQELPPNARSDLWGKP